MTVYYNDLHVIQMRNNDIDIASIEMIHRKV